MQIVDFLFDYIDRRVKSGDDLFGDAMESGLQCLSEAYLRVRDEVYPRELDASDKDDARLKRIEDAVHPELAELPPPGGLLFLTSRFKDIMSGMADHYSITHVYDFDPEPPKSSVDGIREICLLKWRNDLFRVVHTPIVTRAYAFQLLLDEIITFLRRLSPRALILTYDTVHINRLFILAARALNISAITIQHGYYSCLAQPEVPDGRASDYILVWGEQTKKYLVSQGICSSSRVKVLGYPYPVIVDDSEIELSGIDQRPICFVGQNWEDYNTEFGQKKQRIVSLFLEACSKLGISYHYRPHPAESRSAVESVIPAQNITPPNQSVREALSSYSAFVGINSTMLLETSLSGKISVQIYDPGFGFDDFQQIGACYSCQDTLDAIMDTLRKIQSGELKAFDVNPECIKVTRDPVAEFREMLEELLARHECAPASIEPIPDSHLLCILGMEEDVNTKVAQSLGLSDDVAPQTPGAAQSLEHHSEPYGPSVEMLSAFGDIRTNGLLIPTGLDIGVLNAHLNSPHLNGVDHWGTQKQPIVFSGIEPAFTLPYWRSRSTDVSSVIIISDPREMANRRSTKPDFDESRCALQWMETLSAALTNSLGIPHVFVFPDEWSRNTSDDDFNMMNSLGEYPIQSLLYGYCLAALLPFAGGVKSAAIEPASVLYGAALVAQYCYRIALTCASLIPPKELFMHSPLHLIESTMALNKEVETMNTEITNARKTMSDLSNELGRLSVQLEQLTTQSRQMNYELEAIRNSRSWRVLGLARRVGGIAKKVLRKQ